MNLHNFSCSSFDECFSLLRLVAWWCYRLINEQFTVAQCFIKDILIGIRELQQNEKNTENV
jgi:hypothetical protein